MHKGIIERFPSSESFRLISIIVVSTLCYINSLSCDFVFDDHSAIKSNKDVRPTTPLSELFSDDFWGTPMTEERSHGSYRPLIVLSFRLNYMLSGLEPMTYHLVNVILHAVVSVLAYWCLNFCSFNPFTSWIAALLFALHPIHTEAVTGVVGRAELLSAAFVFLAVISYVSSAKSCGYKKYLYLLIVIVMIPLAALSKETGVTVAAILLVYEALVIAEWQPRLPFTSLRGLFNFNSLLRFISIVGTTLSFLFMRLKLMPQMPHFSVLDNPAAHAASPSRELTYAYLVPLNVMLLLYPWPLVADWALGTVPLISGWTDPRNVITAVFFISLAAAFFAVLLRAPIDKLVSISVAFIVIPFIPASNLFFPVGFVVAERVLYLPSFGWCALVALGFERIVEKLWAVTEDNFREKIGKHRSSIFQSGSLLCCFYTLAIVLVAFYFRSFLRNFDWADQISLFRAGLRFNQRNAKLFNNVGHTYEAKFEWNEALAYFYKAARTHVTDVGAHRNVARALKNLNELQYAERALRRAISLIPSASTVPKGVEKVRVTPAHLDAFLDLAAVLAVTGTKERMTEAEQLYSKVMQMRPDYLSGFERRGELMFKLGRYDEARRMFKDALKYNARCANCYYNLAVVDLTQTPNDVEKLSAALGMLDTAIQLDPEHYYAMHAFASVVQEKRAVHLYDRARDFLKRVVESEKSDNQALMSNVGSIGDIAARTSDAYFRAAMLETDLRNFDRAHDLYKAALKRDPRARSVLFNLAWLNYKDLDKPGDALPYLKQLLKFYPNNTNGWLLMGYVHVNHTGKYDQARKAFEKVIQVAPHDPDQAGQQSSVATAHYELCRLFEKEGKEDHALPCLEQLLKHFPNDPVIASEYQRLKKRHSKTPS